jgi:uncharacterized phiE125 gp8 family phage protein
MQGKRRLFLEAACAKSVSPYTHIEVKMIPILITGPAVEPVSLAEMKAWLRLDGNDEDDLVAALTTAARLLVEASAGRFLITQVWRIVRDAWPADSIINAPYGPLTGLQAARVFDAQGNPQLLSASIFTVETAHEPARLRVVGVPMGPGRAREGIEIDLILGYGPTPADVPAVLRQAIRLLVAYWFENRGDGRRRDLTLPKDVATLIAPYRRARL